MALYSKMSKSELTAEMETLQEQGQKAYDDEAWSQYEVLMQKWYLAKSYQIIDDFKIKIGATYRLAEEYDRITVTSQVGVMAWGIKESNATEVAVPIAMLSENE